MSAYKDAQANNDITRNVKQYKDLDLAFRHDFEREDGDFFNDIRGELNYKKGLLVVKEDYKQIGSKDIYQFNSDVRLNKILSFNLIISNNYLKK